MGPCLAACQQSPEVPMGQMPCHIIWLKNQTPTKVLNGLTPYKWPLVRCLTCAAFVTGEVRFLSGLRVWVNWAAIWRNASGWELMTNWRMHTMFTGQVSELSLSSIMSLGNPRITSLRESMTTHRYLMPQLLTSHHLHHFTAIIVKPQPTSSACLPS